MVRLLKKEDVIFFLGAGASMGTPEEQREGKGIPSASKLAEAIGKEFGTGSQGGNLTKAASVAASQASVVAVKRFVAERIRDRSREPLATHQALARVRPPIVVTTNYDDLCEKAIGAELGGPPAQILGEEDAVHLPRGRARVVKLHGDFEHPCSLVLTGEDYLNWEVDKEGLFSSVTSEFQHSSCVFVGYSLNDENLRRAISLVRRRLGKHAPKHYALVREVDEDTAAGFGDSVEFVEGDATRFLEDLAAQWLLEDPERVDLLAEERNLAEASGRRDFDAATRSCERLQEEYERRGALNSAAAAWQHLAMEAEGTGAAAVALEAYTKSGRLYRSIGAEVSTEEVFSEARQIARAEGMHAEEQEIEELLQEVRLSGGDYEAVLRETKEALDAAGCDASSPLLYSLYAKRASAKEALGNDDGAVDEIESALGTIPSEALYFRIRLQAELARTRAASGRWDVAEEVLDAAESEIEGTPETTEDSERRRSKALVDLVRANIHFARGENRGAIALYDRCAAVLEELGESGLFVSALRGATACRRAIGDSETPQMRARAADAANAAPEYRRIKDKEHQGIAELAQEQFVMARAHLQQGITEAQSVHAPIRERGLRRWYAEVLRRAGAPVEALQQYVLAGDIKKARELAARLAVSPVAESTSKQLADFLVWEASSGGTLAQAAAFAALGAMADVLPENVLPDLTDLLAGLGDSVSSMQEHSYIVKEAANMGASILPLLDRDKALRVAESLVRFITEPELFWTTYEQACLGLVSFASLHAEAVNELEVPVDRLDELVGGDVINDRHNAMQALVNLAISGNTTARDKALEIARSRSSVWHVSWRYVLGDTSEEELATTIRSTLAHSINRVQPMEGGGVRFGVGALSPSFLRDWELPEEELRKQVAQTLAEAVTDPGVIIPDRQAAAVMLGYKASQFDDEGRRQAIEALMGLLIGPIDVHPAVKSINHPLSAMTTNIGHPEDIKSAAATSLLALSGYMGDEQRKLLMREIEKLRASQVGIFGRSVASGLQYFFPSNFEEERWLTTRLLLLLNAPHPTVRQNTGYSLGKLVKLGEVAFNAELFDTVRFLATSSNVEDRRGAAYALSEMAQTEQWSNEEVENLLKELQKDRSFLVRSSSFKSSE